MADVRRLDGSKVASVASKRDVAIAKLLAQLVRENDDGKIKAIAVIYLTPRGGWVSGWQWPEFQPDSIEGFPWGLALRGALREMEYEIASAGIDTPPVKEPPDTDA